MKIKWLLLISFFVPTYSHAEGPNGYSNVPSQSFRLDSASGYVPFPNFPNLEIVKEGEGTPNHELAITLGRSHVSSQVQSGHFASLQVRDLAVDMKHVYSEGTVIHFPFVVSVKHVQGAEHWWNGNQGTINVAGIILVNFDGTDLHVTVVKFDDSQVLERFGRRYIGFNQEIDLTFAQSVVVPVLESWFNADRSRIQTLLGLPNNTIDTHKP